MAASGFFLGGAAEGAMGAQKQALAERTQTEDVGLRTRALELQENQFGNTVSQQAQAQADKLIADTLATAGQIIKDGIAGGADPVKLRQAVMPLIQSVTPIAQRVGRDPAALMATIDAQIGAPGPVSTAAVAGRAAGVKTIEQERAVQQQPEGTRVEISPFKTPKDRIEVEDKLRDDYLKASKDFIVQRDFMDRIREAPATGAGDLALVFSYMKVLDPGSTVREGEYATASNAAGVPDAVRGMWNQVVGGGKLAEGAREQIRDAAGKIWTSASGRHSAITNQFADIAKRNKLDVNNVIVDLNATAKPATGVTSFGQRWNLRGP